MLGSGWQRVRAGVDPMRAIESAELGRTLDPALVADLDGDPAVAARAALAIGRTKRAAGAVPLDAHLHAGAPGIRAMAAYGLGVLADPQSLDPLRALAHRDGSSAVRYAAVDAIGRIVAAHPELAGRAVASDLLTVARTDADPIVRGHAVAQLDVFHAAPFAHDVAASLERLQNREADQAVRWHVAWVIARAYPTLVSATFLGSGTRDRNETVRLEAVRAWGHRGDANAEAVVRASFDDPSWRVQYEAREALLRLEKKTPTAHLTEIPPDIHLPPIPAFVIPVVTAPPSPVPGASSLAAPLPATLDLAPFVPPTTAFGMDNARPGAHERALIHTTKGDVTVTLYREWAPSTVANFVALARRGYFDGNRWFRIVPDFVVQTGDPTDNGEGDAGYQIPAEENPIEQRAGVIAMGLNYDKDRAQRDSAGTQFYITLSPSCISIVISASSVK